MTVALEGTPLLEVRDLRVYYPHRTGWLQRRTDWVRAVDGVDLQVGRGRTLALVGESGCGKTTLGRTIVGLQAPTQGSVRYLEGPEGSDRLLGRAQMVFQDPLASLDPRQHVVDIIAEPLVVRGDGSARARVVELLRLVGLSPDVMDRYPHEFSGGQRQRIGIARALAAETPLVVCDELTSALDVSVQAQIITLLRAIQERLHVSFVYISHDLAVVRNIAHEVAVMYFGKVVEFGDVDRVYAQPRHPYTIALLSAVPRLDTRDGRIVLAGDPPSPTHPPPGCRFQDRCWLRARLGDPEECVTIEPVLADGNGAACHFSDRISAQMGVAATGATFTESAPSPVALVKPITPVDRALLRVRDLRVDIPMPGWTVHAVRTVSLDLAQGESLAIVGESGSGKSISVLSLLRLAPPQAQISATELSFEDVDLLTAPDRVLRRIRGGRVGFVFQDPLSALDPTMSVGGQITETIRLHLGLSREAARRRAADLLGWVGVPQPVRALRRYPHQLSGGMRQRCLIAIALSCDPALLIADEPTTAVDVTVQAQIIQLLRRIKQETGMALLLITHDLGVAAELVDRLETMYAGRIVEEGPVHDVIHAPRHPYTMALLRSRPTLDATELRPIDGSPPDLTAPISGCAFLPRCGFAVSACSVDPELTHQGPGHRAACWVAPSTSRIA